MARSSKRVPRIRRTAEEAQRLILDAAQKRLTEGGPEAVRLQDVAADVGIAHPTILHHFGSRDGLLLALEERTLRQLNEYLLEQLGGEEVDVDTLLARVERSFGDDGFARLLAWHLMAGAQPPAEDDPVLARVGEAVHAVLVREAADAGLPEPDPDEGHFRVRLAATALFGEALMGPSLTAAAGLGDPEGVRARFRKWLGRVLSSAHVPPS